MSLSVLGIIFALVALVILCYKRVNLTLASIICGIIVIVTSSLPVLETVKTNYMQGFGGYITSNFLMFALSALFGRVLEDSGAAAAFAKILSKALGRFSVYGCMIATAVLVYGGVSVFVIVFTMYPIFLPVFKESNLPARFIPGAIFGSSCTFACSMMPGTPTVNNLIPTQYLGTTAMAAPTIGLVTSAVSIVLIYLYFEYEFRGARKRGEGFDSSIVLSEVAVTQSLEVNKKLGYMALIPMIVLISTLNIFKLDIIISLLLGTVVGIAIFWNKIEDKSSCIEKGVQSATFAIINTASVIGFGKIAQSTAGFQSIIDSVTGIGGNPLISIGLATTLISGATGSGTGGIGISMEILAERYLQMGVNPEAIHRIVSIASNGLDSLPHNGLVITTLATCKTTHKEGYKAIFVTSVLITLLTLIIAIVMGGILY